MKNLFYAFCCLLIIAFTSTSCDEKASDEVSIDLEQSRKSKKKKKKDDRKVSICHYSKGSDSWKTILVSSKALKGHLKHGDYRGECDEAPVPGCTDIYVQGFETDVSGWIDGSSGWNGTAAMVASGTNGIVSSAGGFHGLFEGEGFTAPKSVFEGIGTSWEGNWTAEIDVYLDPNWATSTGFEYTVGINRADVSQILEFVFQVNKDASTNQLWVGVSNLYTFSPQEDLESRGYQISTAGWYKLQQVFYDNAGNLSVDLNLVDGNGSIVFSETINTGNAIGTEIGGNNYGWFTFINVDGGIAVDEQKRLDCSDSEELL